ncbi:hypothetical protein M422DRAFT_182209, partial [Sphaerobolus stellatus SS14]
TAHNSQGQSLNVGCINFASCPNLAMAYVMLSHLRSLDVLTILCPFASNKSRCRAPEEVWNELKRLDELAQKTLPLAKECLQWYYGDLSL